MNGVGPRGVDTTWWTRERVIAGMKRFYADTGRVVLSTEAWIEETRNPHVKGPARRYPSFYGVLRYFTSFRDAWAACGIETDRLHEDWTEIEDWYLREAIGIIPRAQIGRDLHRSDGAVKRRIYDLGLHTYRAHGWTLHRVERVTSVPRHLIETYLARGDVPYFKGTKCVYVDPADLLVIPEINWAPAPHELAYDVKRSLIRRLASILAGGDWRANRPYRVQKANATDRRYRWRITVPGPKPVDITPGDHVRLVRRLPGRPYVTGRVGLVHGVWVRRTGEKIWMARVEFLRHRATHRIVSDRVTYTLPLSALEVVPGPAAGEEGTAA